MQTTFSRKTKDTQIFLIGRLLLARWKSREFDHSSKDVDTIVAIGPIFSFQCRAHVLKLGFGKVVIHCEKSDQQLFYVGTSILRYAPVVTEG